MITVCSRGARVVCVALKPEAKSHTPLFVQAVQEAAPADWTVKPSWLRMLKICHQGQKGHSFNFYLSILVATVQSCLLRNARNTGSISLHYNAYKTLCNREPKKKNTTHFIFHDSSRLRYLCYQKINHF